MGNTICHILISERFSYSDEEYHHVLWRLAENFHLESSIAGQVRGFFGGALWPWPCQHHASSPALYHLASTVLPLQHQCHLSSTMLPHWHHATWLFPGSSAPSCPA